MISSFFLVCAYRASGWIENHQYKSKIRTHLRLRRCGSDYLALVDLKGIDLRCGAGRVAALRRPRRLIHSRFRSIPLGNIPNKRATPSGWLSYLVDLKGIEPSNLTDANRALSQLSYKPLSAACIL